MKTLRLLSRRLMTAAALGMLSTNVGAQISTNPDKFLGNITTNGRVDYGTTPFYQLWNQLTAENECKWQSIEGQARGQWNWWGADAAYNYAKEHGIPFKFHTLVWGSQYPTWMDRLSKEEQLEAVVEWMDAVKQRYPDLMMIDVVNEAISGHAPAPYKAALGGDGRTGYDWVVRAFQMAHERWPDAILIYNDYNTFQWQRQEFIDLVRTLRDAGAPIDAYGCQSHDLNDIAVGTFRQAMTTIHDALQLPMYSTEYDIDKASDQEQLQRYKEQIPVMWEADYVAGVTLWGYIHGKTWVNNSGIVKDGQERPAMTWLREYMQTAAARQAKSPFPGMQKEASVYVSASSLAVSRGEAVDINIDARLRTKQIQKIELYVNNRLAATLVAAPYVASYTPSANGRYDLRAVVTATDGSQYERYSGFTAYDPRSPYNGPAQLPGTLELEDFDSGAEGMTYHDSDRTDEGKTHYRSDNGGVDIVDAASGYALGYTAAGEWLEYTVDVTEAGEYEFDALVSSGTTGAAFSVDLVEGNILTPLFSVSVPKTADNSWDVYRTVSGRLSKTLTAGRHILRLTIDSPYGNLDKITFRCTQPSGIRTLRSSATDGAAWYTLDGRRLSAEPQAHGIYIYKGKKVRK